MSLQVPPFPLRSGERRWVVEKISGYSTNSKQQIMAKVHWNSCLIHRKDKFCKKKLMKKTMDRGNGIFFVDWKPTLEHPINFLHLDTVALDLKKYFSSFPSKKKYNKKLVRTLNKLYNNSLGATSSVDST